MTRFGTCYFVSRLAAERYYSAYTSNSVAAVADKLKSGEIKLGKPPLNAGERLVVIDSGTRYAVDFCDTKPRDDDADYAAWCEDESRRDDAREGFDG